MALQPKRLPFSSSPPWHPKIMLLGNVQRHTGNARWWWQVEVCNLGQLSVAAVFYHLCWSFGFTTTGLSCLFVGWLVSYITRPTTKLRPSRNGKRGWYQKTANFNSYNLFNLEDFCEMYLCYEVAGNQALSPWPLHWKCVALAWISKTPTHSLLC